MVSGVLRPVSRYGHFRANSSSNSSSSSNCSGKNSRGVVAASAATAVVIAKEEVVPAAVVKVDLFMGVFALAVVIEGATAEEITADSHSSNW